MTPRTPDAWQFVLLALAAYRVYRLVARDTITEPLRAALTYPDDQAVTLDDRPTDAQEPPYVPPGRETGSLVVVGRDAEPKPLRVYLSTLIRCPWCLGAYLSAAAWAAFVLEPRWATFLAAPWALSAVLGLLKKNLDP